MKKFEYKTFAFTPSLLKGFKFEEIDKELSKLATKAGKSSQWFV